MIRLFILLFVATATFVLFSCKSHKQDELKKGILSESEMAVIMIDIHIAEAGTGIEYQGRDSFNYYIKNYYYAIFEKHHIDREIFLRSMDYYLDRPNLMQDIYLVVQDSLNSHLPIKME
ncbi:DUF4296 domain-containing protein [Bacteroidota bacterium]